MSFDFENQKTCELTGKELSIVIKKLDMSYDDVARLLGLHRDGKASYGRTTIKQMVRDKRRISPPMVAALWFVCCVELEFERDWPAWYEENAT